MVDSHLSPRRRLSAFKFHLLWGAALLLFLVLIGVTGAISGQEDRGEGPWPFQPWTVFAFLAFSLVYSVACWRRLDEAAREAHKWAWYWGAGAGGILALGLMMLGASGLSAARAMGFDDTLSDGITLVLGAEVIAYFIAWGFWWLRRR